MPVYSWISSLKMLLSTQWANLAVALCGSVRIFELMYFSYCLTQSLTGPEMPGPVAIKYPMGIHNQTQLGFENVDYLGAVVTIHLV